MKKLLLPLLALCLLLSLAACGARPAGEAPATREIPPQARPDLSGGKLDLSALRQEEAFREIELLNLDPEYYLGVELTLRGEVSRFESHGRTICYVGVRDEDGCIENLELRFPGDGSLPEDFPGDGSFVCARGRVDAYEVRQGGKTALCPFLAEASFSLLPDGRD